MPTLIKKLRTKFESGNYQSKDEGLDLWKYARDYPNYERKFKHLSQPEFYEIFDEDNLEHEIEEFIRTKIDLFAKTIQNLDTSVFRSYVEFLEEEGHIDYRKTRWDGNTRSWEKVMFDLFGDDNGLILRGDEDDIANYANQIIAPAMERVRIKSKDKDVVEGLINYTLRDNLRF